MSANFDTARRACRVLTRDQRVALKAIYDRGAAGTPSSYLAFRRTARLDTLADCVMIPWCNMLLGIERDGHTHS